MQVNDPRKPPRDEPPASAPSVLAALLGDYSWQLVEDPMPSRVFVAVLSEFGIGEPAARVAIDRVTKRGLLERTKDGGSAYFTLSRDAAMRRLEHARFIMRFGEPSPPWDETWTLVLTSIPEAEREIRSKLRNMLVDAGFAKLHDAAWVRPGRDAIPLAQETLVALNIAAGSVFNGNVQTIPGRNGEPMKAYDLEALGRSYKSFAQTFGSLSRRAAAGRVKPAEAFLARTRLMSAWHAAIKLDPRLPDELLPPSVPKREAREVFLQAHDLLGPAAEAHLHRIIGPIRDDLPRWVRHFTTVDVLSEQVPALLASR